MTTRNAPASPLVLGAMSFGTLVDEDTSFALLDRFVERGGTWIDTADCYSFWASESGHGGASEEVIGRWLAARPGARQQVRISTKVGAEPLWPGSWPEHRTGLSPRAIGAAVEGILDRLGVDRIDLLWLHQEDRAVAIEDTVDALAALTSAGTVTRVGASNHPAWRIERARAHAKSIGSVPIDAFQLNSTYLRTRPGTLPPGVAHPFGVLSDEQRDFARDNGIEVWAYTPLLSGAYDNQAKPVPEVYDHPGTTRRLAVLEEIAAARGVGRGQIVLAWQLARGIRPIVGGSRVEQLDAAMDAASISLTAQEFDRLDTPV
ncbi:aldo/keto reductase [Microbacterium oxydans]|uniref:aldo/keto reductase n=1 Tax=Microbacterium TaxID=33882 RepID=UPI000769A499|nr:MULTISPECIES: aldo/keto reductase [unclassified Microbacterium]MBE7955989.1 aldo/keto reductase [Microbacterium sp. R1]NYF28616.1 aryl-alcohol dehydrogenase-like predicted oxidoreductase [Microbacterium sp. JAI119]RBO71567.1 aldo/keto reductase [Microbacterium sp. H6]